MNAQHRRGAALVAVAVSEHFSEQRDFKFAQGDLVEVAVVATVQVSQIPAD